MSTIKRLPPPTASLLHAAQTLPSFEAAVAAVTHNALHHGARNVSITIHPPSMRFTVRDDGHGFSPPDWPLALLPACTSRPDGRGQSLAALAALASVELCTRTGSFTASKLVRGGVLLEDNTTHAPHTSAARPPRGVTVDVWELFFAVPVRRGVESARPWEHVVHKTREAVVALALANPTVAVVMEADNGLPVYASPPRHHLSIDAIQAAFGNAHGLGWQPVRCVVPSVLRVGGFVARRGCSTSGLCLVSLNGAPVPEKGWLHHAVRRVWKGHASRRRREEAGAANRFPAYVLNCHASQTARGRGVVAVTADAMRRATAPTAALGISVCAALHAALAGTPAPAPAPAPVPAPVPAPAPASLPMLALARRASAEGPVWSSVAAHRAHKRTPAAQARFAETLICKRPRRAPTSPWASTEARRALLRPLSARAERDKGGHASASVGASVGTGPARVCVARPATAGEVEGAFRRGVHGWRNPCMKGRAAVVAAEGADAYGRRAMWVRRESIPRLRVVGQVECKFIVVADGQGTVYAVDQHAASERALYEGMLRRVERSRGACAPVTPPVAVALSYVQRATAARHADALQRWGWRVELGGNGDSDNHDDHDDKNDKDDLRAHVRAAPRLSGLGVVLDQAHHMTDYLDSVAEGARASATPASVLEAVASAACHAAVRFGDVLTRRQCAAVVRALAACEFPFICAHGRPSIVPLAVLGER